VEKRHAEALSVAVAIVAGGDRSDRTSVLDLDPELDANRVRECSTVTVPKPTANRREMHFRGRA
jgi:hypothetical protein